MTIICLVPEIWSATDRIFCHSGPFFALLPPYGPRKSKFSKNGKNNWRYYHFTNLNNSHMMYGSSDIECNRQNILSFWTIFCHFTPLTTQKIKILEKWKKCLEISSIYNSVPKIMIICYTVPEIWCVTDVIIFYFGPFFALLPP